MDEGRCRNQPASKRSAGEADYASASTLMEGLVAGDEAALAGAYDRYSARVHGLALRVGGDPSNAEEVTQDVFVAAWRHRARFDRGRGSLCAWLLTTARNRTVDLARGGRVKREVECGLPRDIKSSVDVEAIVLKELEQQAISVAIAALPRHQRYAIQQAYFGGQSAREIAHEVGVPVSTVKGRLRLGLERLGRDVDLRIATGRADS